MKTDLSPKNAPLLNDPKITTKLVKANAVIGVVPKCDKVGISCAICHTITDNSVFEMPGKGSVGRRLDGRATHSLDMGKLLALAANSRAYYPNLQLELGGKTIGRGCWKSAIEGSLCGPRTSFAPRTFAFARVIRSVPRPKGTPLSFGPA